MKKNVLKSGRKDGLILKVGVNSISFNRVLAFVRDSIDRRHKFYIVTPNPEIIVSAHWNRDLLRVLNLADISLPDGVGLFFAWNFLGFPGKLNLIKGREMLMEMVKLANKKSWRVFFLGGRGQVVFKAAEILRRGLKGIKIEVAQGPELNSEGEPINEISRSKEKEIINAINEFKPQLLFVGFGAPKQEKWIDRWLSKLDIGGAMVVGGAFDYLSGKTELPPKWMAEWGLEWLWRLIREPWRIKRILKALLVFPFLVLLSKMGLDTSEPL